MHLNYLFGIAIIPLIIGFVWYNPKVFGNVWLASIGKTEEEMRAKGGNMFVIFGCTYLFSLLYAAVLLSLCVHQMGAYGMIGGSPTAETLPSFQAFINDYGTAFRTFKHGAFHGTLAGLFLSFFFVGIPALFEQKGWKFILVHVGYFTLCSIIMGALICQFI